MMSGLWLVLTQLDASLISSVLRNCNIGLSCWSATGLRSCHRPDKFFETKLMLWFYFLRAALAGAFTPVQAGVNS